MVVFTFWCVCIQVRFNRQLGEAFQPSMAVLVRNVFFSHILYLSSESRNRVLECVSLEPPLLDRGWLLYKTFSQESTPTKLP